MKVKDKPPRWQRPLNKLIQCPAPNPRDSQPFVKNSNPLVFAPDIIIRKVWEVSTSTQVVLILWFPEHSATLCRGIKKLFPLNSVGQTSLEMSLAAGLLNLSD